MKTPLPRHGSLANYETIPGIVLSQETRTKFYRVWKQESLDVQISRSAPAGTDALIVVPRLVTTNGEMTFGEREQDGNVGEI